LLYHNLYLDKYRFRKKEELYIKIERERESFLFVLKCKNNNKKTLDYYFIKKKAGLYLIIFFAIKQ
jgi:hypothetical protein